MDPSILPYLLVILVLIVVFCFSVSMFIKTSKLQKQRKKALKELKAKGLTQQLITVHTYGLPVADGVACTIQAYRDRIEFYSGTTNITLGKDKITDMCVKTETDIQQQYVSSIGGAVGGAVLFGPIGAMIGGRAKKKTSRTVTYYLIITYNKADTSLAYLCFDVSGCFSQAYKMVADFHKTNTNGSTHIEL